MPRKFAKKNKSRPRKLIRKARQSFRDKVLKIVNKNREMKRLYFEIAENTITPDGTGMLNFTYPSATGYSSTFVSNKVLRLQGDSLAFSRDGNEITPRYWEWKGIVKYQGAATAAALEEVTVKMVLGFVDGDNASLPANDGELQLSNGTTTAIPSSYQAVLNRFNWKKFRPVATRVFKLQPAAYTQSETAQNLSTAFNSHAPVSKQVTLKHYFGKNPKNIVYPNSGNVSANSGNLQLLIMSRYTNSDGPFTTSRNIEVTGQGHFAFYDC